MPSKIWVKVKAQAREESVTQLSSANYQVSVSAPREKGKANQAIIALLAEYFSVPKSSKFFAATPRKQNSSRSAK
jgi:uncharacterized protein YggU (UPF0235/DUF167 family)